MIGISAPTKMLPYGRPKSSTIEIFFEVEVFTTNIIISAASAITLLEISATTAAILSLSRSAVMSVAPAIISLTASATTISSKLAEVATISFPKPEFHPR